MMLTKFLVGLAGLSTVICGTDAGAINTTNTNVTNVNLHISTNGGGRNKTAPLLYGWMIEDINVGN